MRGHEMARNKQDIRILHRVHIVIGHRGGIL